MSNDFRKRTFRGSRVENVLIQLERLHNQSKSRAERYVNDQFAGSRISHEYHEGAFQAYKDALELLKEEFDYPTKD